MNERSIRTVQVIDTFFPVVDGVIQTVNNYAIHLNPDCPTAVVFPRQAGPYDYASLPYPVHILRQLGLKVSTEYTLPALDLDVELTGFLDEFRPDLIHVHSPFFTGSSALRYAKKRKIPTVATFHSKYYDDVMNVTGSRQLAKTVSNYVVQTYNKATQVWACSAGTAETFRGYGYKGEIRVMDNGTSFHIPPEQREGLRQKAAEALCLPPRGKTLLFVGHLIWHKNLRLVLDAFRLLLGCDPDFRLLIAGDGYDGEAVRAYAKKLDFPEGTVRFLGRITDRDLLAGVMLSSDLFFFPSVYDNSPLVVREAASLGLPSLLTAGSNSAEAVEKDVSGFTAEEDPEAMKEEILRIFADSAGLEAVGRQAEQTVAKTWDQIVDTVRARYLALIDEYDRARAKKLLVGGSTPEAPPIP